MPAVVLMIGSEALSAPDGGQHGDRRGSDGRPTRSTAGVMPRPSGADVGRTASSLGARPDRMRRH
jgi:hypothetical protein